MISRNANPWRGWTNTHRQSYPQASQSNHRSLDLLLLMFLLVWSIFFVEQAFAAGSTTMTSSDGIGNKFISQLNGYSINVPSGWVKLPSLQIDTSNLSVSSLDYIEAAFAPVNAGKPHPRLNIFVHSYPKGYEPSADDGQGLLRILGKYWQLLELDKKHMVARYASFSKDKDKRDYGVVYLGSKARIMLQYTAPTDQFDALMPQFSTSEHTFRFAPGAGPTDTIEQRGNRITYLVYVVVLSISIYIGFNIWRSAQRRKCGGDEVASK